MLRVDNNKFIQLVYEKSTLLNTYQKGESPEEEYDYSNDDEFFDIFGEDNIDEWQHRYDLCLEESKQSNKAVYDDIKARKATDIFTFEKDNALEKIYLGNRQEYTEYPRRNELIQIITKAMQFQEKNNLVDYHPTLDSLSGEIKALVEQEIGEKDSQHPSPSTKVRNVIHQSLQSYNSDLCDNSSQNTIEQQYFNSLKAKNYPDYDYFGKLKTISPSHFLWLPSRFTFNQETGEYNCTGKIFNPLENWDGISELKDELSKLVSYLAPGLKETHNYFGNLSYPLERNNKRLIKNPEQVIEDNLKNSVFFKDAIHAIVKIAEITIQPKQTYDGQWHVEGFSSDSVLYTCLYVIEQDDRLENGRLKFKRSARNDDDLLKNEFQPQHAHRYCPSIEYLCDPNKLIPLGQLDITENLMIIFPNQNIHKVKGITNNSDIPLKRKIIALFVVNHEKQPFTIDDVRFTATLEEIKIHRLKDMFERSKNKQTETQKFNYCEH